ncbi:hypothetical protein [Amycolatopsis pigmentata]|uniref:Lipoprotein n=1 Tax=Amycolatopsis pigmentata TaxID=450801 RepID=A0ABW5G3T2_9PSEU
MTPHRTRNRIAGALFAALMPICATVSGCTSPAHLRLTQDDRVHLETPAPNSTVRVPFTVKWTAKDFTTADPRIGTDNTNRPVLPDQGYFAVFVDKEPMAPGESFQSLLPAGSSCAKNPTCPDMSTLRNLGVLVTDTTSVTVDAVSSGKGVGGAGSATHAVTIVLVDARGQRIGDSNWYTSFTVQGR